MFGNQAFSEQIPPGRLLHLLFPHLLRHLLGSLLGHLLGNLLSFFMAAAGPGTAPELNVAALFELL